MNLTNYFDELLRTRPTLFFVWALGGILFLSGCGTAQYRHLTDKAAYRLIEKTEATTLGETNYFNIDTAYSVRDPQSISPTELIENRAQTNELMLSVEGAIDIAVSNSRD
ncbi:MAG: hypothetical protein ACTHLW_11930, partial [Verrucomicrobiota bacterium]